MQLFCYSEYGVRRYQPRTALLFAGANDHLHPVGGSSAQPWTSASNNSYWERIVSQGGLTAVTCLPAGAILQVVIGFVGLGCGYSTSSRDHGTKEETQLRDDHGETR